MAAFETTRTAPFGAITALKIVQGFANLRERFVEWNDIRVTRNALSKLSDRELADIGISRGDIDSLGLMRHIRNS
ncbi:DUF1127 domain-containing protein [Plastorhodobacter daqingensis]|uniref:DUF1127 domain-containing protein n=1 Tax=Plastorhodobacter daqingensis TaxID=1387281 RepID=A0ABW2URM4_9RHOB